MTVHVSRWVLLASLAGLLAACGGPSLQPVTPEMQQQRRQYQGYSLLLPQGDHWSIAPTDPRYPTFVRQLKDQPQYSVVVQVKLVAAHRTFASYAELRAYVVAAHAKEKLNSRWKNWGYNYAPDPKYPRCIRYMGTGEDHSPANLGSLPFLFLEGWVFVCPHPDRPDDLVVLDLSQRAPLTYGTAEFEAMANQFFADFRFEKFKTPPTQ